MFNWIECKLYAPPRSAANPQAAAQRLICQSWGLRLP